MNIHLVLDDELAGRIDEARGDLPRVRWIRQAINEKLAGGPMTLTIRPEPPAPEEEVVIAGTATTAARADNVHQGVVNIPVPAPAPKRFRGPIPKPGARP